MYFTYDTLSRGYFTPKRCYPIDFPKLSGNDFEFAWCTCYTHPLRYYYYKSDTDELLTQHILKTDGDNDNRYRTSLSALNLSGSLKVCSHLLKDSYSSYISFCNEQEKKHICAGRQTIFPIGDSLYILYNFDRMTVAALDILMDKLGIESYQIYYAKKPRNDIELYSVDYILKFTDSGNEAQFIFYFNERFQQKESVSRFRYCINPRFIRYPILRNLFIPKLHMRGMNIIRS